VYHQTGDTSPGGDASLKPREPSPGLRRRLVPYYFLLPAVLLVGVFLIWPFLRTTYQSFTDYSGLGEARFVGLENYISFVQDPILIRSLSNTLLWVVGSLLLPVGLGLFVATISFDLSGGAVYRVPFLLPYALSGTAIGVVWEFMLQSDGAINAMLKALGLGALSQAWLLSPPLNTLSMIVAATWQSTGVAVILFLVGLQTIPREPIEAARIDGAEGWTLFRHITLPLLRPMTIVVVGITLVNSLKTFDIIWVMTQGGPSRSSETLAVTMYRETFLLFRYGYGSAIAVVLSVIVLAVSGLYLRRTLRSI
jgi:ABC-type sugar transport system permease subunit